MNTRPNTAYHLGNNRVDLTADGGVWQAMDYYPFGLPMASSYLPGKQRWLFGGKEMDRTAGLDLLDFEARPYDPTTGRFRNPDPLAEKYYPITPYLFCAANPILIKDPTGEEGVRSTSLNGKKTITTNVVVLIQPLLPIKDGLSSKEIERINKTNSKIIKNGQAKKDALYNSLLKTYGNAYNSKGEKIDFVFNIELLPTEKYNKISVNSAMKIAHEHGIPAILNEKNQGEDRKLYSNSLAVVIPEMEPMLSRHGEAYGPLVKISSSEINSTTVGHEIGHTFGLDDTFNVGFDYGDGIMSYPPRPLTPSEVDEIWENANESISQ